MLKAIWLAAFLLIQNPTFKVSGVVVREDNQDPANATNGDRVVLRGSGGTSIVDVGDGGAFEFPNIRPGNYQIVVGPMVTMDPVAIAVTDKDVSGLRVVVPDVVTVRGSVVVEGDGPRPRFQLTLTREDAPPTVAPTVLTIASTFNTPLHSGQYRVSANNLPRGYSIKSIMLGTKDLLTQPMKVASGDSEPVSIVLGVSTPPPWVKVGGRVNANVGTTPTNVTMSSAVVGDILTAAVMPDGSFDFDRVLPGSYTALASTGNEVSAPVNVTVASADVTNLEIRMPRPKEVRGRIVVQGNLPMPRVMFSIAPTGVDGAALRPINLPANPQQDGSFSISLPEGERQITIVTGSLPQGYSLASFTYGATDLLKNPLRVAMTDNAELRVTFNAAGVNRVNVSGRVTGLLTTTGVRVVLMSPVLPSIESPVGADGSFSFTGVIPGNYTARLSLSGLSNGTGVTVRTQDVKDLVINYPRDFIVTGHIIVEGGGATVPPDVMLEAKNAAGMTRRSDTVNNGVIVFNLKDGEYSIAPRSIPAGYQLKSIMYGTTDLQKVPLKIDGPVTWEIIVRLTR
jgi:hypothetical protein